MAANAVRQECGRRWPPESEPQESGRQGRLEMSIETTEHQLNFFSMGCVRPTYVFQNKWDKRNVKFREESQFSAYGKMDLLEMPPRR